MSLSDVILGRRDVWEQSEMVDVSKKNDGNSIVKRYFEHGKEKLAKHVYLYAARLCSAQPPLSR